MDHNETLGRRIQAYRKASGLSQEALGEQLQVSRQAVSKWESDITVPELDSLIAMSRIFGVSIGELLGVETKAADAGPEKSAPCKDDADDPERESPFPGLTEKELAAVEAIAARYAREAEQHRRTKWSKKKKCIIIAAVCLLVVAALCYVQKQVTVIQNRFNFLQNQVTSIDTRVSNQINSMSGRIEDILTESANILSFSEVSVTGFDLDRETVTLRVTAAPKEWTAETMARFTAIADGVQILSDPIPGTAGVFTAEELTLPMSDEVRLSVTLLEGGAARTEQLETLFYCHADNFKIQVEHFGWSHTRYPNGRITMQDLSFELYCPYMDGIGCAVEPVSGEVQVYRNQDKSPVLTVPLDTLREEFELQGYPLFIDSVGDAHGTTLQLEPGDTMLHVIKLQDNFGRVTYTPLEAYRYSDDKYSDIDIDMETPWTPGDGIPE